MSNTAPTNSETVELVADALLELREDNRCLPPEDPRRIAEMNFVRGALALVMRERHTSDDLYGPAHMDKMVQNVFRLADIPSRSE